MREDNAVRLDTARAARRGHVESHFLKAVCPDGARAIWLRHTVLCPRGIAGTGIAEVWAIAFERDRGPIAFAKQTHPLRDARYAARPFSLDVGATHLDDARAEGQLIGAGHRFAWELGIESQGAAYRPYPLRAMYEGPLPRQKTLTPIPSARITGDAHIDGVRWALDGWRGMQGHNWGEGHSERYAWVHCNSFEGAGPDTWLELMTARVRVGGVLLPWLSVGALSVNGVLHRFDGPRALTARDLSVRPTHLRTTLRIGASRLRVSVGSEAAMVAGLHYENPDGSMTYCLNSKLAEGSVALEMAGERTRLRSTTFALEVGTKDPAHGVAMVL